MLVTAKPVTEYSSPLLTVAAFGQQSKADFTQATKFCLDRDAELSYTVFPPSDQTGAGFQTIYQGSPQPGIQADGVLLLPGQAGVIQARDCPIVALEYRANTAGEHRAVLFHAGRAALTSPQDCTACGFTIVAAALKVVAPRGDYENVRAYITAGICQDCFVHPGLDDERYIAPFRSYPGVVNDTYGDRRLNLIEVLRFELRGRGVNASNIIHDGKCTKEHPGFSSKRRGDTTNNHVVGVLQK